MKVSVKTLACCTISLLFSFISNAQLKLPLNNSIAADIRKVIHDYPNQFRNLQGSLIIEHAQSADYECNFQVEGGEKAKVTLYSASNKVIASWEALLLTTEDFETGVKKFKAVYNQLNNLAVTMDHAGTFYLKGKFEAPAEEKKFSSTLFSFDTEDEAMKKLKVELLMVYEPMEWKVKLLVYDREREDHERGTVLE